MEFSPYLTFHGQANAAQHFYQQILGGSLIVQTAGQLFGEASEKNADLVVHSVLTVNEHFKISALDVIPGAPEVQPGQTVSMGLHFDALEAANELFSQLATHGHVIIAFTVKEWGGSFGVVDDQFGVRWNIDA